MFSTRKSLSAFASAAALMLLGAGVQAATYAVDVAKGLDTNPGNGALPFKTIQKAINIAPAGSHILVAAGTYHESLSWVSKNLTIQGAGINLSIIDSNVKTGGPGGRCLFTQNLTYDSLLQGFTFQNGKTMDNGGGMYNSSSSPNVTNCLFTNNRSVNGAGMYNDKSSPSVSNCSFTDNLAFNTTASSFGGGMGNINGSLPTVTQCTFTSNTAYTGGGMYNAASSPHMTSCDFYGNQALADGGGMVNITGSSPEMLDCDFLGNQADTNGGGMSNYDTSHPTITHCTFTQNSATNNVRKSTFGGGIYNLKGSPTVTNCIFSGNLAIDGGGGMYNDSNYLNVTNCVFSLNTALGYGGGIQNNSSTLNLTNCTFSNNHTDQSGGGIYSNGGSVTVTNCIVWGNTARSSPGIYGVGSLWYSDIQDLINTQSNSSSNINANPLFVDALKENLHLMPTSPCRYRGTNSVVKSPPFFAPLGVIIDLDNNPRIFRGGRVDLGVYESQF